MTKIPDRLKNPDFRFVLVRREEKRAFEVGWQHTANYRYDDSRLLKHIEQGGNYGVIGGYGNLLIVDYDDTEIYKEKDPEMPETFKVKTGSGKYHAYYLCDDTQSRKALGCVDIQAKGKYVVCPGSIHPDTKKEYEVCEDKEITTISKTEINRIFELDTPKEKSERPKKKDNSRSAKEYGVVCNLIREGHSKEQIFEIMQEKKKVKKDGNEEWAYLYEKWNTSLPAYREHQYNSSYAEIQEEIEEATPVLSDPELFNILDKELDKKIVKEENTRRTILLIALGGKLTINSSPPSTNLMVNDESGAGKDYCVMSVLKLLPDGDVIRRKRISETAFTYWCMTRKNWTWDGKVFYNEDIGNSLLNSDVFKVMSSSDGVNRSTIVIRQQAVEIETKGKPVMVITIATAQPKAELLRRYPICNLNTTEGQTKLIVQRKAKYHRDGVCPEFDPNLKRSLRYLQRVKVKIPFAESLVTALSTKNVIMRTHFDRFMDYVKFSTAIHQFQREKDGEYLLADKRDYEIGREALITTTSNVFSIPLTKNQKRILEKIEKIGKEFRYSVSDLETHITFISDRTLRKELDRLTEYGFLSKYKEDREGSKKPVMVYSLNELSNIYLPEWSNIEKT